MVIPLCLLVDGLELGVRYIKDQIVISPNPLFWDVSVSKTDKIPCACISYILVLVNEVCLLLFGKGFSHSSTQ